MIILLVLAGITGGVIVAVMLSNKGISGGAGTGATPVEEAGVTSA